MCQIQTVIELDLRNCLCFLYNFIHFETIFILVLMSTLSEKRNLNHLVASIYFDNFFTTSKRLFIM